MLGWPEALRVVTLTLVVPPLRSHAWRALQQWSWLAHAPRLLLLRRQLGARALFFRAPRRVHTLHVRLLSLPSNEVEDGRVSP